MKEFYKDNHNTLYCLDFRKNDLPDESVQMVCTSPPYWGLRKYSGEQELIWGDNHCEHEWDIQKISLLHENRNFQRGTQEEVLATGHELRHTHKTSKLQAGFCSLCGAWKGAYGLEPTPELYVQHTIEILREIRRVLRKDGVVFWDIGDSYWGGTGHKAGETNPGKEYYTKDTNNFGSVDKSKHNTLKPKDLCLIPFRIAIAAQEDGWWVRSVIIWSKSNPMPESVTDRPTESHEYILMLTKSGTNQYWTHRDGGGSRVNPKADYRWVNQIRQEEVAIEPADWKKTIKCPDCEATGKVNVYLGLDVWQGKKCPTCNGTKETQLWKRINLWQGHNYYWDADAVREPAQDWGTRDRTNYRMGMDDPMLKHHGMENINFAESGRNIRTVWEFPTRPYPEAHFAVFPEKLPELCIKAATPEVGCCSKCGAPWGRVLDKKPSAFNIKVRDAKAGRATPEEGYKATQEELDRYPGNHPDPGYRQTLGWQPTCKCNADKVPSVVVDPFAGAGTTLWVAKKLNRKATGFDTSEKYCQLAVDRCRQQVMI